MDDCKNKIEEIKTQMEEDINEKRANDEFGEEPEDGWPDVVIEDKDIRVPDALLFE